MTLNISPETKVGKIDGWNMMAFNRGEIPIVRLGEKEYTAADFLRIDLESAYAVAMDL